MGYDETKKNTDATNARMRAKWKKEAEEEADREANKPPKKNEYSSYKSNSGGAAEASKGFGAAAKRADGGIIDKRSKAERIAEIVRRRTGPSEETKKLAMDWSEGTALEEMREEKGGVPSHEKMTNFKGINKMLKEKKKK